MSPFVRSRTPGTASTRRSARSARSHPRSRQVRQRPALRGLVRPGHAGARAASPSPALSTSGGPSPPSPLPPPHLGTAVPAPCPASNASSPPDHTRQRSPARTTARPPPHPPTAPLPPPRHHRRTAPARRPAAAPCCDIPRVIPCLRSSHHQVSPPPTLPYQVWILWGLSKQPTAPSTSGVLPPPLCPLFCR